MPRAMELSNVIFYCEIVDFLQNRMLKLWRNRVAKKNPFYDETQKKSFKKTHKRFKICAYFSYIFIILFLITVISLSHSNELTYHSNPCRQLLTLPFPSSPHRAGKYCINHGGLQIRLMPAHE